MMGEVRLISIAAVYALVLQASAAAGIDPVHPPDPPPATTLEWFDWYEDLLQARLDAVTFNRDQTRYISSSLGDDANDGLTQQTPWATVDRARAWINSPNPTQETREALFRRGDAWRTSSVVSTSQTGVRFADYGDPKLPRPYFSGFTEVVPPDDPSWNQHEDSPVYFRAVAAPVSWTREDGDADLDDPLARQSALFGVLSVQGSWWWDSTSQRLYIHPRNGDDPRSNGRLYEIAFTNGAGFSVSGDRSLVENLRADGYGLDPVVTAPQKEAFQSRVTGTKQAVFRNCESYYGGSHIIAHNASLSAGGIATFVKCVAGFTKTNTSGETVLNTFAGPGGNQTIFHECTVARGTLPDGFTTGRRSDPVFGHTMAGGEMGLTIVYNLRVIDHPWGSLRTGRFNNLPPAESLEDVRCFIVGSVVEGGDGTGDRLAPLFLAGAAMVNCRYQLKPANLGTNARLQSIPVDGWWINSTLDLDLSNQTHDTFDLYRTGSSENKPRSWNSAIVVRNIPDGVTFRVAGGSASASSQASFHNTIFAKIGSTGDFILNLPNDPNVALGNAYWQVAPPSTDALAVPLTSALDATEAPDQSSPLAGAGVALPFDEPLEFDQALEPRFLVPPTIGPLEVVGAADSDLNGDGVVDGADLAALLSVWGTDDPAADLNGDGVVNGTDLATLLAAWNS